MIDAWRRGQLLSVHGVIYRLRDGLLRDLGLTVDRDDTLRQRYDEAIKSIESQGPGTKLSHPTKAVSPSPVTDGPSSRV